MTDDELRERIKQNLGEKGTSLIKVEDGYVLLLSVEKLEELIFKADIVGSDRVAIFVHDTGEVTDDGVLN